MTSATIKQRMRGATDEVMDNLVTGPLGGGNDGIGRRTEDDPNLVLAHTLRASGADGSEDGTGRGTPWVSFATTESFASGSSEHLSPSLRVENPVGNAHGSAIRRLTPLECERLQGFPDGWTCLCRELAAYAADPDAAVLACRCPDSPRYRAMGNAVTVPVIEWLGRRLMAVMEPRDAEPPGA